MNMTVSQRITLMLVVSLFAIALISVFGLFGLKSSQGRFEYYQVNISPSVQVLSDANTRMEHMRVLARDYVILTDAAARNQTLSSLDSDYNSIIADFDKYEKELISDDTDRAFLNQDRASLEQYMQKVKMVFAAVNAGKLDVAREAFSQNGAFRAAAFTLGSQLQKHTQYNWKLGADLRAANLNAYNTQLLWQGLMILAAVLFSVFYGLLTIRHIKARLTRLDSFIAHVSSDLDFTPRIRITHMDELGKVGDAVNKLLNRLQDSLHRVSENAQSIARVSQELATNSTQVANAAHQQSSASANVAATVEQMTVSVNHVADRAQEANEASTLSGNLATSGSEIITRTASDINNISNTVNQAEHSIRDLESKAQDIAKVIQVIKDVADQTNLLALNAAIEAARAGEQGRGFAVVADEVRKLAERTASSAQEITETITGMLHSAGISVDGMQAVVKLVEEGVSGAEKASDAITQIRGGSTQAVQLVGEITLAIKEQGVATTNIAQQVEGIAQMAEESSAAAANTADSARELEQLSEEMKRVVALYKLQADGTQAQLV
jgi:methyl-accepting chemotaxis protein